MIVLMLYCLAAMSASGAEKTTRCLAEAICIDIEILEGERERERRTKGIME